MDELKDRGIILHFSNKIIYKHFLDIFSMQLLFLYLAAT